MSAAASDEDDDDKNRMDVKLATYYYPWYGPNSHWRNRYTRGDLDPPQRPVLGEYDSTSAATIAQHVRWSARASISTWITSWWGPGNRSDAAVLENILTNPEFLMFRMRAALFYETKGRCRIKKEPDGGESWDLSKVGPDLAYIAEQYFDHPNYLRIQGRPVFFVYLTKSLFKRGLLQEVLQVMREAAAKKGHDRIYIVGDQVRQDAPTVDPADYEPFQWLDGITTYGVYGNIKTKDDCYARQTGVDKFCTQQEAWRQACSGSTTSCAFFPSVSPGFNNKGKKTPLSRRIDEQAEAGSLFRALLQHALTVTDQRADHFVLITTWNEWHEDTQIEPVDDAVNNGRATNQPVAITHGLEYDPYGTLYLDILQEESSRNKAVKSK